MANRENESLLTKIINKLHEKNLLDYVESLFIHEEFLTRCCTVRGYMYTYNQNLDDPEIYQQFQHLADDFGYTLGSIDYSYRIGAVNLCFIQQKTDVDLRFMSLYKKLKETNFDEVNSLFSLKTRIDGNEEIRKCVYTWFCNKLNIRPLYKDFKLCAEENEYSWEEESFENWIELIYFKYQGVNIGWSTSGKITMNKATHRQKRRSQSLQKTFSAIKRYIKEESIYKNRNFALNFAGREFRGFHNIKSITHMCEMLHIQRFMGIDFYHPETIIKKGQKVIGYAEGPLYYRYKMIGHNVCLRAEMGDKDNYTSAFNLGYGGVPTTLKHHQDIIQEANYKYLGVSPVGRICSLCGQQRPRDKIKLRGDFGDFMCCSYCADQLNQEAQKAFNESIYRFQRLFNELSEDKKQAIKNNYNIKTPMKYIVFLSDGKYYSDVYSSVKAFLREKYYYKPEDIVSVNPVLQ